MNGLNIIIPNNFRKKEKKNKQLIHLNINIFLVIYIFFKINTVL